MNDKNYTLEELADIGAKASYDPKGNNIVIFTKAILDAIGYEFPKDEEREAFDAWANANNKLATTAQFEAWKAGREELRKGFCSAQCRDTKTEPPWIPWHGTPIIGPQTRYEVEFRGGERRILSQSALRWIALDNTAGDIIAYRILD
jgi:hypothetical protein